MRGTLVALASLLVLSAALYAGAQGGAAGLTRIGAAAAVSGLVRATAPGAVGRVMSSGKPVFLNDRVTSDASGKMQVMLLDETVFTLGPNADMVLDEFVYDPTTSAGKVTARITKGAFRFVTGKIARQNPNTLKVKLAVGTIGVRGTVVVGATGPDGSVVINAGAGSGNNANEPASALYLENAGETVDIDQTGQGSSMKPGQPPSPPKDMGDELGKILGNLETAPKGKANGGAKGEDAGKESGQETAKGQGGAIGAEDLGETTETLSSDLYMALQEASEEDAVLAATWDDLRSIPTGTGQYSGSGAFRQTLCTPGISCNFVGTWGFNLTANFGTRNISGSAFINTVSGGGNINHPGDTVTLNYNALSGLATFTTTTTNATYNFKFQNVGHEAAGQIEGSASYNAISDQGASVGTVIAPRQ